MTPDTIAEAHLLRELKGKKAAIKLLLNAGNNVSEPLKSALKKKSKTAKPNKKQAS